jgi:hypothetical protein
MLDLCDIGAKLNFTEIATLIFSQSNSASVSKRCGLEMHGLEFVLVESDHVPVPEQMNARQLKYYEELCNIASRKGGQVLSNYVDASTKMRFRCHLSHEWETSPGGIKHRNHWCPHCSGNARLRIEDLQALALSKGGKLISTEYRNSVSPLIWECAEGYRWQAKAGAIRQGHWCPHCSGNAKITIEELQAVAAGHSGWCLEISYMGRDIKHRWRCQLGHEWAAIPGNVRRGHWCPKCARNSPATIEEIRAFVAARGGEFLSDVYISPHASYNWQCAKKHVWESNWGRIKHGGAWCPLCRESQGERICRGILERMGVPFAGQFSIAQMSSRRFDFCFQLGPQVWLIEFDGKQHFKEVPWYHMHGQTFEAGQQADIFKTHTALNAGYNLIRIDYKQVNNIEDHIKKALMSGKRYYFSTPSMYNWLIPENPLVLDLVDDTSP